MTKIQKNQICFPSCSSWPNDRNWPKNTQKKLRKTKQQIITLIRIKTYWDFSGFQGANYQQCHGVVSRRKHQLVPKASCDDPKPSPSFCLPIVATVAGVAHFIWLPHHQHCGCALPLRLSICCQRLPKENQSHQHDSKSIQILYIIQKKTPRKNCSKNGRGKGLPCPLSWWWLTDWGPRVSKWWWVWILTQIDTGSQFPRGESPPRHKPLVPPLWKVRGQGSQDAPRGSHRFCSDLWNNISMLLTGTPYSRMIQVRPEKTLYYILFYLPLRLVPNGYYIRDTSSITRY